MSNTKPTVTITFRRLEADDDSPDVSYLKDTADNYKGCTAEEIDKYVAQDMERYKAWCNDEWHMIGIRARATIIIRYAQYATSYELDSPGLWGIESDSGAEYLESVFQDECDILRADIEALKLWSNDK